jgi:hypothetical protein
MLAASAATVVCVVSLAVEDAGIVHLKREASARKKDRMPPHVEPSSPAQEPILVRPAMTRPLNDGRAIV